MSTDELTKNGQEKQKELRRTFKGLPQVNKQKLLIILSKLTRYIRK